MMYFVIYNDYRCNTTTTAKLLFPNKSGLFVFFTGKKLTNNYGFPGELKCTAESISVAYTWMQPPQKPAKGNVGTFSIF